MSDTEYTPTEHLWEPHHPYYAAEGNYYSNGCHEVYESWSDFLGEQGNADLDMNLVYRFDWKIPDPADYLPFGDEVPPAGLFLYYIGQRKALARSVEICPISEADEPAVREWLTVRAKHLRLVWAPLMDGVL